MFLVFLGILVNGGSIIIVENNIVVAIIEFFFAIIGVVYAFNAVHKFYQRIRGVES